MGATSSVALLLSFVFNASAPCSFSFMRVADPSYIHRCLKCSGWALSSRPLRYCSSLTSLSRCSSFSCSCGTLLQHHSIGYSANLCDDPLSWVMSILWVFQKNALSCRIVYLSCLVMLPSHFVMLPDVQRGPEEVLPMQSTQSLCQYLWVNHMVTTFTSF